MYRYSVDNAVTYTSEDFVQFRESPFACWLERLTLENPDHGIPADIGTVPPSEITERQDDMADTLREESKDVRLIDWDADEASRRSATLEAMRKGADFIVNGQLALGPLSGAANLLVRTSGYSQLGDFLYIPCETQSGTTAQPAFRLCFLADLLHSLQGQLPPQMLIIRGGDKLIPLQTEDHIYHYRAVKHRFMETMRGFRKHIMPDPAESAHFGRWSDCAHEVLKQRLQHDAEPGQEMADERVSQPLRKAVGAAVNGGDSAIDLSSMRPQVEPARGPVTGTSELAPASGEASGAAQTGVLAALTLAEQARMLEPDAYEPGPGVYRLGTPRGARVSRQDLVDADQPVKDAGHVRRLSAQEAPLATAGINGPQPAPASTAVTAASDKPRHNRRASDAALRNLEFIGREQYCAGLDPAPTPSLAPNIPVGASTAPASSLRDPRTSAPQRVSRAAQPPPELSAPLVPTTADAATVQPLTASAVDMDDSYPVSPPPRLATSEAPLPEGLSLESLQVSHSFGQPSTDQNQRSRSAMPTAKIFIEAAPLADGSFSNSLITSDNYRD